MVEKDKSGSLREPICVTNFKYTPYSYWMVLNLPFMDSNERIPSFGINDTDTLISSYTANVR